jgi:hypothetical protein
MKKATKTELCPKDACRLELDQVVDGLIDCIRDIQNSFYKVLDNPDYDYTNCCTCKNDIRMTLEPIWDKLAEYKESIIEV